MAKLLAERSTDISERRAVKSWVLYDLANVLFSINIVSLYFPLWVVDNAGGRDAHVGVATGLAMLLVFLAAPLLGLTIDATGRRIPFLAPRRSSAPRSRSSSVLVDCGRRLFFSRSRISPSAPD